MKKSLGPKTLLYPTPVWVVGVPDIEKVRPIIFSPEMRHYHKVGDYLGEAFSIGKSILKQRS